LIEGDITPFEKLANDSNDVAKIFIRTGRSLSPNVMMQSWQSQEQADLSTYCISKMH